MEQLLEQTDSLAAPDLQPRKGRGRGIEAVHATRSTRATRHSLCGRKVEQVTYRGEWHEWNTLLGNDWHEWNGRSEWNEWHERSERVERVEQLAPKLKTRSSTSQDLKD